MKRNYDILSKEIQRLDNEKTKVKKAYTYKKMDPSISLYQIENIEKNKNPVIYINAGLHGEEPAGIYSLLSSMPIIEKYYKDWNFILTPCLNPIAYTEGLRYIREKYNLNDYFGESKAPESVKVATKLILKHKPIISIDLHEDMEGEYLTVFVTGKKGRQIVKNVLKNLTKYVKLYPYDKCYGDICENGVIFSPKTEEESTLEEFAFNKGAKISLTLELPGKLPMFERIKIGQYFLEEFLKKVTQIKEKI